MSFEIVLSVGITVIGAALSSISTFATRRASRKRQPTSQKEAPEGVLSLRTNKAPPPGGPSRSSGQYVLMVFACVVAFLAIITLIRNFDQIMKHLDELLFGFWLFLTMIAGMFVKVMNDNYLKDRNLVHITATQLFYPMLFALVVFYPVWAMEADAPRTVFSFYAAFLNGFFWESVVTSVKAPP